MLRIYHTEPQSHEFYFACVAGTLPEPTPKDIMTLSPEPPPQPTTLLSFSLPYWNGPSFSFHSPCRILTETAPYFLFTFFSRSPNQRYFKYFLEWPCLRNFLLNTLRKYHTEPQSYGFYPACAAGTLPKPTPKSIMTDNVSRTPSWTNNSTFLQSALPKRSPIFLSLSFHDP